MKTKITKKTQYAVAAMLELARSGDSISISDISSRQCIDVNYMGLILLDLKKKHLVSSTRGVKGGYKIARPVELIAVADIMAAVGEQIKVTRCNDQEKSCTGTKERCLAHYMWKTLEEKIHSYLSSITLYDVLQGQACL